MGFGTREIKNAIIKSARITADDQVKLSYDICRCTSEVCPERKNCLRALDMPGKDNHNLIPSSDLFTNLPCRFQIRMEE